MKKLALLVFLFTITLFNLNAQRTYGPTQKQDKTTIQNQIILKLKSTHKFNISNNKQSLGLLSLDQIATKQGNYTIQQIGLSTPKTPKINRPNFENIVVLKYESDINIEETIKELEASNMVEYAERNGIMYGSAKIIEDKMAEMGYEAPQLTPNDQYYSAQWWCENNGTFHNNYSNASYFPNCVVDADIDMEAAWDVTTGCSSVVIALLDSGMKLNHPEMAGRIIGGYDFVNNDNNPTDDHGHGSNVGGICFATGNDGGIHAGVNWSSNVLIAKVLNANNSGAWTDLADGIIWAVDNGADVMNVSIGGSGAPQVLQDAVQYAYSNNVPVIVSAGNDNQNIASFPAAYPQTISVGATTCNDWRVNNFQWGSNYHNTVDLVAPGSVIYGLNHTNNNFGSWSGGTSQAAPIVTGVASLMLCLNPNMSVEDVRSVLRNTAEDQVGNSNEDTPGYDIYHGAGRLNAHQALLAVSSCTDNDNDGVCAEDDCNDNNPNIPTTPGTTCNDNNPNTSNDVIQADGCTCQGITSGGGGDYCSSAGSNTTYEFIENVNVANINNTSGDNGGYADFTSQVANLSAGTSYNVNLAPGFGTSTIYNEYWKIWIDFNKDGDFDDTGEELLNESSTAAISSSISIPASVSSGSTRMRVTMNFSSSVTPCGGFTYGEVEDYTVNIGGAACNIGSPCNDNNACTTNDVYNANCDCIGTFQDADGDGVCDANDECPNDPTNTCNTPGTYCTSQGNNSSYEHIENVNVSNLNYTSGDNGGYADFTSQVINLNSGSGYVINLTPGFGTSSIYTEYWKVWIDFNKDGDFEDAGEELLSESSTTAISSSISIPASASSGSTRMRVSMKYNSAPSPCEAFTYGEVEDYTVNIEAGSSCNAAVPTSGNLSVGEYCNYAYGYCNGHAGSNKEFELTNLATGGTSTYASSSHYASFQNLSQNTNYQFRVRLECGNSGTYGGWSPYQSFTTPSCKLATETLNLNNYPNPFSDRTVIEFSLPDDSPVTIHVYNLTGKHVATLLDNEPTIGGNNRISFDGKAHPSGMYIYTIQAGEYMGTGKMNLIK